jgi:GT2 family glycosyltransferase
VVDDGNSERLTVTSSDLPLRVVRQARSGAAAARNRGAREARTPYLAFLDDDCAPRATWIDELATAVTPTTAVAAIVRNALHGNLFAEASDIVFHEFTRVQSHATDGYEFLSTANLAVEAEAFRSVGGFDERFPGAAAEDRDFCYRWRARGYGLRMVPGTIVDHFHEMNLREFVRQHYGYGSGARLFYSLHEGAARTRGDFYAGVARTVLAERGWMRAAGLGMLVAVSQTSAVLGYLSGGSAHRR